MVHCVPRRMRAMALPSAASSSCSSSSPLTPSSKDSSFISAKLESGRREPGGEANEESGRQRGAAGRGTRGVARREDRANGRRRARGRNREMTFIAVVERRGGPGEVGRRGGSVKGDTRDVGRVMGAVCEFRGRAWRAVPRTQEVLGKVRMSQLTRFCVITKPIFLKKIEAKQE